MLTPILATKLYIPPARPKGVVRERLLGLLDAGLRRKLTLISAPAGFGKTSLVSEWLMRCQTPCAWLSLDEMDNHPPRFLAYLITSLRGLFPHIGEGVLSALQAPQPPPTEIILTGLLNEISAINHHFLVVLDDYHVLESAQIDQILTFLIEYMPPQMHLVITTREDPNFPLARLRARNQLVELRGADLRFSDAETAQFLNETMGLMLSPADIAELESRTEGWVAGLQLAALSMQGQRDTASFIRAFAGDHHYILDYLVDEVLQHQPEAVRTFLLQTAILKRLNGSLCDAVTGQSDSKTRLESLERGNFFVIPLDDKRHWYRYHHLFVGVLSAQLLAEQPEQVAVLHRRASAWYEKNGFVSDAIHHAHSAQDFERMARLVELAVPELRKTRQESVLLGWLKALPDDMLLVRPVLSVAYAAALMAIGTVDGVEARLKDAENWLDHSTPEMMVMDEAEFWRLPVAIAMYRAALSQMRGDVAGTSKHARRVLELASEDDILLRGAAAALLGLADWTAGHLESAYRFYTDGMHEVQKAGYIADTVAGAIAAAEIRTAQGQLHDAMQIYEQALYLASLQGSSPLRGTADIYVGMSAIYRERNDLAMALQCLQKAQAQGDHTGFPQNRYRWNVAMARLREAQGDFNEALDLLERAKAFYVSDFFPDIRPITALKVRVWLAQGRLDQARDRMREAALSPDDTLTYLREFEHITLARVLLAQPDTSSALALLKRLLAAAETGQRTGSVIEILVLLALAYQTLGDRDSAQMSIERALKLAETQGYARVFIDEGRPMAHLLESAVKSGMRTNYARQLLTLLGPSADKPVIANAAVEPLSERELEVLQLLATDLTGPEIARELVISLNTLHTHTKNIYAKLGVNNRRTAVRRAEEFGFL